MFTRQEEYRQKRQRVLDHMRSAGLEAVVLSRRCNFAWYTAGGLNHVGTAADVGAASVVIMPDRDLVVTTAIEAPRVSSEEVAELGIETRAFAWYDGKDAARAFADVLGRKRAACDVRVPGLPESAAVLGGDFNSLRWSLTPEEIARYRTLAREVAEVLESCCRSARPNMTEFELAARIAAGSLEREIRTPVLLIAADERVQRYRHPIPTGKRFAEYGMGVVGGERGGLIVSATRLFSFGALNEDLRRRHKAVCQVDAAMISATRPGKTLGSVLEIAKRTYAEAGFANEWERHHQGGSTGYLAREARATPGNSTAVLVNQAFAWNPSIAGTKSEDTTLVGPATNEVLSSTGQWPTTDYAAGGANWPRCDILKV
jgi:Xaa-Pro dipeptidase